MPQIFPRSANTLARFSIVLVGLIAGGALWFILNFNRTTYVTQAFVARQQPVQFSHKHHVGDDGIDCRYCHQTVEKTASAGLPSTKTCMNCHSQLFANVPYLEIVRESWRSGKPIEWQRVHDLPDFSYFNHSIHVNKGVGCSTCHGRVDLMPLMCESRESSTLVPTNWRGRRWVRLKFAVLLFKDARTRVIIIHRSSFLS